MPSGIAFPKIGEGGRRSLPDEDEKISQRKMHPLRSAFRISNYELVGNVGEKCHLASSLDCNGKLSLVKSAVAAYTSGEDLRSLRGELSELCDILVVNLGNLVLAEDTNLLSSVALTECGTLIVFHSFINLSDSRFLYCTYRSEPSGRWTSYP